MKNIFYKGLLKTYRLLGVNSFFKIKSGLNKTLKWNCLIPDSRYILGNYEPNLATIIKTEIEKGKRFIDIGANAGYFTLLASNINPTTKHIAVEPMPENVKFLELHLQLNDVHNVDVIKKAISDKIGFVEISNSPNLAANTYKKESSVYKSNQTIKIETIDLSTLAKEYNLDKNCFIKIDVEGAELDVLKGGESFLKKHKPNLMLATHDCHVNGVKKECLKLLSTYGYKYSQIIDDKIEGQEDFLCLPIQ